MPRTLRTGSTGPDVAELQNGLNRLPTKLPPLDTDGIFGMRTHTRVRELQGAHQLTSDGIVGPMTWELFTRLLAAIQNGTLPTVPAGAFDLMRPLVLTVAQQHLGAVDFSVMQGGRPKGLDFLIESVDGGGPLPRLTTIDANTTWGRIVRTSSSSGDAHKVGKDNFNYYSLG